MKFEPIKEEVIFFELPQHAKLSKRLAPALNALACRLLEPQ
jgi:hypothetical protein